ncbi:uncharacterized protein [Leptinotarsa decemlineata]|uniref:uncharacterized protein n=1 Tax=Leptinotarsa decemlineata TaxID=7539 RepID=UPI003D3070F3
MELIRVLLLSMYFLLETTCSPNPGNTHHHIHHRIHVPHKIKTIYRTKIIKVPEHHHYFHEKEKIYVEVPKKEDPIYPPLKEEDSVDFSEFDNHEYFGESRHTVVKKRPHIPKKPRKRKIIRH